MENYSCLQLYAATGSTGKKSDLFSVFRAQGRMDKGNVFGRKIFVRFSKENRHSPGPRQHNGKSRSPTPSRWNERHDHSLSPAPNKRWFNRRRGSPHWYYSTSYRSSSLVEHGCPPSPDLSWTHGRPHSLSPRREYHQTAQAPLQIFLHPTWQFAPFVSWLYTAYVSKNKMLNELRNGTALPGCLIFPLGSTFWSASVHSCAWM